MPAEPCDDCRSVAPCPVHMPTPRNSPVILIATCVYGTPDTGSVSAGYHMTIASLVRDPHFVTLPAVYGGDVVRARSRLVRQFLTETRATHLLFWDADVALPANQAGRLVARLVESGHDFVGCTYPKKRLNQDGTQSYAYTSEHTSRVDSGCVEVDGIPLGFALMTRSMLESMVDWYAADLTFSDVVGGKASATVALFQLMIRNGVLMGEDYSFCARWTDMGGKVQLWVGPDCELSHIGAHAFRGKREEYCQ